MEVGNLDVITYALMAMPFIVFLGLLYFGRSELSSRAMLMNFVLGLALLAGMLFSGLPWALFVGGQSVMDIVLVFMVFGSDFNIT